MSEGRQRRIDLLGNVVEYEVTHSTDATEPRIDIDIHGVRVILPSRDATDPARLLEENATWVVEKTQQFDQYRERAPERRFEEGETFPYLGEQHRVVVETRPSSSVGEETLRLANHHVQQTSLRRALETLYRREARKRFERRTDQFAEKAGVQYEQIEIRNQRTRWGSCSTTGTLGLNWRLMMAPPEIIDYVIVHEITHLREPAHSDRFWSLVAEHDPDYEDHVEWLERNSSRLIFSPDDL